MSTALSNINTTNHGAGSKRKEPPTPLPVVDEHDIMKITPLGAGNEVGRSCILLEFKQKKILLDCGLHPGLTGLAALPFFDEIDPAEIDLLLVTHFHIDHSGSLPYFMQKTTFKGRVFMTHPTKAIYKWILSDYVKVSNLSTDNVLYGEQDLIQSFEKIETMDYHQQVDVDGIKFTSYNAGHVLGAAMFLIEIAGVRLLYTGDYSREEDRHLMAAERPKNVVPEVLICESTYGVQSHQPRLEREAMFTSMVHRVVGQNGRCLIPVFALGRAQELLLILDEYWQAHPELHNVPIYYASSLAKKCMTVYQTYTNMMNERIKKQIKISNPFLFKHISNLKSINHFDDVGPCVMMASPGMLQSGLSRELLELWAPDKRNGVIIPGYVVEGTLGKQILSQPDEIPTMSGGKIPLKLSVEYISFSAHVDYMQNSQFIQEVAAPNLVLVHGDSNEMHRLKSALEDRYAEKEQPLKIHTPRNCQVVELYFRGEKMAKTLGSLAEEKPQNEALLEGILVSRDFQYNIIAPKDLSEFTHDNLLVTSIKQTQTVQSRVTFGLVRWHLENMFGKLQLVEPDVYKVFNTVLIKKETSGKEEANGGDKLLLEWEGNYINDMVADSVLAIVLGAESRPASVKATKSEHSHCHGDDEHDSNEADGGVKEENPVKKQKGKIKVETIEGGGEDDSDEQKDTFDLLKQEPKVEEAIFAYYATLLLKSQFGESCVEYYGKTDFGDGEIVEKIGQSPELIAEATQSRISELLEEDRSQAEEFLTRSEGGDDEAIPHVWIVHIESRVAYLLLVKSQQPVVESQYEELKKRVESVSYRIIKTLRPISDTWNI